MAQLFTDGFESNDFSAWTSFTSNADLTVEVAAKNTGVYGMQLLIDDTDQKIVNDSTPSGETRYRMRFYLDPNGITMANNDEFPILQTFNTAFGTAYLLILKYTTANGYEIVVVDATDGAFSKFVSALISDAYTEIELDWKASSAPGADDGFLKLYINGSLESSVTDIDSDTEVVDQVLMGILSGKDAGTSGTLYFDDFDSNDDGAAFAIVQDLIGGGIVPFPR